MTTATVFLVHLIGFSVNGFGLFQSIVYGIDQHGNSGLLTYRGWPGKIKYLTFWCQVIQVLYFALALFGDIAVYVNPERSSKTLQGGGDAPAKNWLQSKRDTFHSSFAFPLAMFVVITFWIIYAIDRELVFPKYLDKVVPWWQNHIIHTFPLLWLLFEKLFVHIAYPPRRVGISLLISFAVLYQTWLLYIALATDTWVYPVLRVLSWPGRLVFFFVLWVFFVIFYLCGEKLTQSFFSRSAKHKAF